VVQGTRLLGSLIGLLVGGAFGGFGIYLAFKDYQPVSRSPQLALLAVLIGAAVTVLGGYLGLLLSFKLQKGKLARKRSAKQTHQFVPRKKRK
jgi:hypothetical protein